MDNQHFFTKENKIMKKLTMQELEQRIKERFPEEEFKIIEYNGSTAKPATLQCCTCGEYIHVSKFNNFLIHTKAYGCKNCHGLWRERERKLNEIKEKYDIIDTFVKGTHTYYRIKCKNCGHERVSTLNTLYRHLECGCKTNVFRGRTGEEFIKQANEHCPDGYYELIGEYKNQITPTLIKHSCGFIWKVRPADMINGRAFCPKCGKKRSRGERIIENTLKELNVDFQAEKRLENSLQRFDFYLENEKYKIAIEFNGRQHYEEVKYFSCDLKEYQKRDERKREYCEKNNITLYVIPYIATDQEIKDRVKDIVKKFND